MCIIEQVGVRGKKRGGGSRRFWRERRENVVFKDVKTMSVVSDKQRQAGSSGSAPATPQGNNLPPAVPPPSISRNPLRGSKCNSLHCDYSSLPRLPYFLYHIFSVERNLMRCVGKLTISVLQRVQCILFLVSATIHAKLAIPTKWGIHGFRASVCILFVSFYLVLSIARPFPLRSVSAASIL